MGKDKKQSKSKKKKEKKKQKREAEERRLDDQAAEHQAFTMAGEMNAALSKYPTNVPLWLRWLSMQDALLRHSPPLAVRQKKMALLEQAIQANPQEFVLYLQYLTEAESVLDTSVLEKRWLQVVSKFRSVGNVVENYMKFVRKRYSVATFRISDARNTYRTVMSEYIGAGGNDEELLVRLFLEMCQIEAEAGYTERVVSLFTALLEYNLAPQADFGSFCTFWNSGCLRIGERASLVGGAYNSWLNGKEKPEAYEADIDRIVSAGKPILPVDPQSWINSERLARLTNHSMPRDMSETNNPHARVLAEELYPLLFRLSDLEPLVLYICEAIGVNIGPSLSSDEPILMRKWAHVQPWSLVTGASLEMGPNFAVNTCWSLMNQNATGFALLLFRAAAKEMSSPDAIYALGYDILRDDALRESHALFVELALSGREVEKARVIFERLRATSPSDAMIVAAFALLELRSGSLENAGKIVSSASALLMDAFRGADGSPRVILASATGLGMMLALSGRLREAVSFFEAALGDLLQISSSDADCCRKLLYEHYFEILEHCPESAFGGQQIAILAHVAREGSRAFPTSVILLRGLIHARGESWLKKHYESMIEAAPDATMLYLSAASTVTPNARSFLEMAVGRIRHSIPLWQAYVEATSRNAPEDSSKVLFRALRAVPWSMELWLSFAERVVVADDSACDDDMRSVAELMLRKGLLLRIPMK